MEDLIGGVIGLVIPLGFYLFFAYCQMVIAQKTNTDNGWFAFIPILNIVLLLQIGNKPIWWIVLFLIPLVNIVIAIMVMMAVAEARGKPSWIGILTIVPIVGIFVIPYLAFSE